MSFLTRATLIPPEERRSALTFMIKTTALRIGLQIMRALTCLPIHWQIHLGRCLGSLLLHIARRRRHIADVNLSLCFPELSPTERSALLKAHFESLGIGVFETAMAWWAPDMALKPLARVVGAEHLHAAMAQGKGVILLTGHFTLLELSARLVAWEQPFHAVYRPHKNPVYEQVMRQARTHRAHFPPIAHRDVRGILRALKAGDVVWYAPDQDHGLRNSAFVPFFGIPACTLTATVRLAQMSGAAVVPYFARRLAHHAGYEAVILPALADFPSRDLIADTTRINQLLETYIRRAPEQYLWVHRRFKTRGQVYSGNRAP